MATSKKAMQLTNHKIFVEAYSTLDIEPLIDVLADDCVYESQMVLTPLKGKKVIGEFLQDKFERIRNTKAYVACSLARVVSGPIWGVLGEPCIVMRQRGQGSVALLKQSDDGKITRIELCIIPTPSETEPLELE
jgi:hypothetical protein